MKEIYTLTNLKIKEYLNELLAKLIIDEQVIINKINISKDNRFINVKLIGTYNKSFLFSEVFIEHYEDINIYINKLIVNNNNILQFKKFIFLLMLKNEKLVYLLNNNKYYNISLEKQIINFKTNNLYNICELLNICNEELFYVIDNLKDLVIDIVNDELINLYI